MNIRIPVTAIFLASALIATQVAFTPVSATAQTNAPASLKQADFGALNPDPANITGPDCATAAVGGGVENAMCVFPTANDTIDPANIQWAIDNIASGGTVLLKQKAKGAEGISVWTPFDFPEDGHVTFSRDLTIEGEFEFREDDGRGVRIGTTISGGQQTFLVGQSASGTELALPSVSIKNIRFVGATAGAIKFGAGANFNEVSGCSIVNYKYGDTVGVKPVSGAFPIAVSSVADPLNIGHYALTGKFNITNNYIGEPVGTETHYGTTYIANADLTLTISGNRIGDAGLTAVAVFGNTGRTIITNNEIYKTRSFSLFEGAAVAVGVSPSELFSANSYNGSTVISNNNIYVDTGTSSGIMLLLYPPGQYLVYVPSNLAYEVSDNTIEMVKQPSVPNAALACIGACSNSVWKDNVVTGTAGYGILVTSRVPAFAQPPEGVGPQKNQFIANDLTAFVAESSQSYIGEFARHNRFVRNDYGSVDFTGSAIAGAEIRGDSNEFFNEKFHGDYPGKTGTPPVVAVLLGYAAGPDGYASEDNILTALRVNKGAIQPCNQVIDMNWEITGVTSNVVPGLSRCDKMPVSSLKAIRAMTR